MKTPFNFMDWFIHNWSRTALSAGITLVCLAPIFYKFGGLPLLLVYLHLPVYMIHQYEEHAEGKFKAMVNQLLAGGVEKITDLPIFLVNIIGVWIMFTLAINGAVLGSIGVGLIASYSMLINAILHIVPTVRMRQYNPGLLTSIVLFLPLSIYTIFTLSRMPEVTAAYQLLGIGLGIVLHVLTFSYLIGLARRK